jgi:hypothetical protein
MHSWIALMLWTTVIITSCAMMWLTYCPTYRLYYRQTVLQTDCTTDRLYYRQTVLQTDCTTNRLSYRPTVLKIDCTTDRLYHRQTVLQTDCPTDRLSYRQTVLQTDCPTNKLFYRQTDCPTDRLSYRQTVLQTCCPTYRLVDRHRETGRGWAGVLLTCEVGHRASRLTIFLKFQWSHVRGGDDSHSTQSAFSDSQVPPPLWVPRAHKVI